MDHIETDFPEGCAKSHLFLHWWDRINFLVCFKVFQKFFSICTTSCSKCVHENISWVTDSWVKGKSMIICCALNLIWNMVLSLHLEGKCPKKWICDRYRMSPLSPDPLSIILSLYHTTSCSLDFICLCTDSLHSYPVQPQCFGIAFCVSFSAVDIIVQSFKYQLSNDLQIVSLIISSKF